MAIHELLGFNLLLISLVTAETERVEICHWLVTTCTYACQMDDANPLNCKMMWSTISKVICGLSVFIGGFIAFFGHRYFQSQQFFFGAYAAGLVSFVVMSLLVNKGDISYVEVLGLSFAIAIIGMLTNSVYLYSFHILQFLSANQYKRDIRNWKKVGINMKSNRLLDSEM